MTVAGKLLKEIEKVTKTKQATYTIKGVSDLTEDDIERLKCYASTYEKTDGIWSGFLPPNEKVAEVLRIYRLLW